MTVQLLTAAFRVAASLAEARADLAWAVMESAKAERALAAQQAVVEQAAVESAGGEKGLGPNAAAQQRARALAVVAAFDQHMCEVDVLTLRDQLAICLQGLAGGEREIAAELLTCEAGFECEACETAEAVR